MMEYQNKMYLVYDENEKVLTKLTVSHKQIELTEYIPVNFKSMHGKEVSTEVLNKLISTEKSTAFIQRYFEPNEPDAIYKVLYSGHNTKTKFTVLFCMETSYAEYELKPIGEGELNKFSKNKNVQNFIFNFFTKSKTVKGYTLKNGFILN